MLRVLGKVLYWLAILVVSLVLLVLLVRFFESRDDSELEGARASGALHARSLAL
jgi:hypothetical protein